MRPPKQAAAPPAPREGPERSGGPAGLTILSREEWREATGENRLAGRLRAETPSVPLSPSCRDGPTLWRTSAPRFTAGSAWAVRPGSVLAGWGEVAVSYPRRCSSLAREGAPNRAAASRDGARSGRLQPRRLTRKTIAAGEGRLQPGSGRRRFSADHAFPACYLAAYRHNSRGSRGRQSARAFHLPRGHGRSSSGIFLDDLKGDRRGHHLASVGGR